MRVVHEAGYLIDACLVRPALGDAGIPVFVRDVALPGGGGGLPAGGLRAIFVHGICWPQAVLESLPLPAGETGDVGDIPGVAGALTA